MNSKREMRISARDEEAIRAFLAARERRPGWTSIAPALRPTSVADGYRLQGAIHERLGAAGDRRLGWKVGSTAPGRTEGLQPRDPVIKPIQTG